jgi:hypothetical protein
MYGTLKASGSRVHKGGGLYPGQHVSTPYPVPIFLLIHFNIILPLPSPSRCYQNALLSPNAVAISLNTCTTAHKRTSLFHWLPVNVINHNHKEIEVLNFKRLELKLLYTGSVSMKLEQ